MEASNFRASGYPTFLEHYQCYRDPTRGELIDGMELKNHPAWDARQVARWRFFYPIDPRHLGDPQRNDIKNFQAGIYNTQKDFNLFEKKANENLKNFCDITENDLQQLKRKWYNSIATSIFILLILFYFAERFAVLPVFFLIAVYAYTFSRKKELKKNLKDREAQTRREILEMQQKMQDRIAAYHRRIREYEDEIRILQTKIPEPPDVDQMEADLRDEIMRLKTRGLSEIAFSPMEPTGTPESASNIIEEYERRHLIQGWGLLQQPTIQGPFGVEKTGLERIRRDIGAKIATWWYSNTHHPIFRVLYLQFLYLLPKSISVYGCFYDVVTREQYGMRSETFHYNHVANFSINAAELEVPEWLQELHLPESFMKNLFGQEVNVFSLTVSSGTHFRCTLIDDAVIDAINCWLRQNEKSPVNEPLPPIQAEVNYVHIAHEILKQVREGVEKYDYWVRPVHPDQSAG